MDERIEQARRLYERARLDGEAAALDEAARLLDGVEADGPPDSDTAAADLAVARGMILHGRYLDQREAGSATGDPRELPLFEQAARHYQAAGDQRGEGEALFWAGCCQQIVLGDHEAAIPLLERSLDLATQAGDRPTMAEDLRHLGIAAHAAGHLDQARAHLEASTELRRETGHLAGVASNLVGLTYVAAGQGRQADALACAQEAADLAARTGAHGVARQAEEARAALNTE
jgi:tetratricopeptide (TPR) repeat protein